MNNSFIDPVVYHVLTLVDIQYNKIVFIPVWANTFCSEMQLPIQGWIKFVCCIMQCDDVFDDVVLCRVMMYLMMLYYAGWWCIWWCCIMQGDDVFDVVLSRVMMYLMMLYFWQCVSLRLVFGRVHTEGGREDRDYPWPGLHREGCPWNGGRA